VDTAAGRGRAARRRALIPPGIGEKGPGLEVTLGVAEPFARLAAYPRRGLVTGEQASAVLLHFLEHAAHDPGLPWDIRD
jgi:hypothetical protein